MGTDHATFSMQLSRTADGHLAGMPDIEELAAMLAEAASITEQTLTAIQTREQLNLIACHAGCSPCCNLNVAVLMPEALTIAAYLRERENSPLFAAIAGKVEKLARYLHGVDDAERIRLQVPCAFLDQRGWCTIHPVRPLMCRGIAATDPAQCRRSLTTNCMDDEEPVMLNLVQKFLYDEAFRLVAAALERHGLDPRGMELHAGVQAFIDRPVMAAEFLAGRRIRI
jgi:Fe-S-cluster containining protein